MKSEYRLGLILLVFVSTFAGNLVYVDAQEETIPEWVRNIFVWYGQDVISENELLDALKFLIENGILVIESEEEFRPRPDLDLNRNSEFEILAIYSVDEDDIILIQKPYVSFQLLSLQQDKEKHEQLWNLFTKIIPLENRADVIEYTIFTDGDDENSAFIERYLNWPSKWILSFDIVDMFELDEIDDYEAAPTIIHEYGHILTLSSSQMRIEPSLIYEEDEKFMQIFVEKEKECLPNYFAGDGCSFDGSYINAFYQEFWTDIYPEWNEVQYIEDDEEYFEASDQFYEKYRDRFLTYYASASVDEDIAESWTIFVLEEKSSFQYSLAKEKMLFFYDYPELVELRKTIRENLDN